ncbi:hypothetical protein SAMN05444521_1743 [Streptomyces sp. 3214.6]|nr:hypothetical protein SAMN05444521_1743 [Streptomyces sp. 3214.6]
MRRLVVGGVLPGQARAILASGSRAPLPLALRRKLTLRLFDHESGQWSLNWSSSSTGRLFPPVVGRFDGDRGAFYGDDTHDGKDVRARFIWSGVPAVSARWEQAFSLDGGKTWLTN